MSSQPTPSPSGAAARSGSSSTASPAGSSGLVADPGPAFDPAAVAAAPAPEPEPSGADAPSWGEEQIRSFLTAQGLLTHQLVGVGPKVGVVTDEWKYLADDLDAIAPALCRMANRIPAVRAAAAGADPIAVGLGFLGYGARSIAERQAAVAIAEAEHAPAPARPMVDLVPDVADAADAAGDARDIPPLAGRRA